MPSRRQWLESIYNTAMACGECGTSCEEIEPRTFSFNSPYGACQNCDGIGYITADDRPPDLPDLPRWTTAGRSLAGHDSQTTDSSVDGDADRTCRRLAGGDRDRDFRRCTKRLPSRFAKR